MNNTKLKEETLLPVTDFSKLSELCCDSLEQVTQIVDHIAMAITITNAEGDIEYCNQSFSDITGYTLEELKGKNPSLLSFKTTPAEVYSELWGTITQGEIWKGRLVNRRKNNQRYLAEIKIVPLRDEHNAIKYFMAMQKDISDSHIIKEEHSNQGKTLQAILNTIPSALALINSKQDVLLDNLAYKTLATDFKVEPAQRIIEQIKQQHNIEADLDLHELAHRLTHKVNIEISTPKQKRWFACRLLALEVSDIDIDQYFAPQTSDLLLLTITEFTQEKIRAERQRIAELQTLTAESEMVHTMQETLHAVLHQLHAPVNMIGNIGCLMNNCNSGVKDAINMAINAGNDALEQLQNAIPERPPEAKQLTNINQVIHELSQISMNKLLQNSIELQLSLTATLPSINAQPARLRLAFKKVLDNAIDAIAFNNCAERTIEITTKSKPDGIVILFDDSGIGIPKADRIKIFEPFYSTKPQTIAGSRGIGLSLLQQIINEHSGTVEFKSGKQSGTRVCLFLPKL